MNTEQDQVGPKMFRDCEDCQEQFPIHSAEQAWFIDRGLRLPKRCKRCRRLRRVARGKDVTPDRSEFGNLLSSANLTTWLKEASQGI